MSAPCDPMLPRIQDLDWFLRFALAGGQLKVWDGIAAVVEVGKKPGIATLEVSAEHIRAKFSKRSGPYQLDPVLLRRLDAYLDIERASIWISDHHFIKGFYYLMRSFWLVPRLTLFLERFCRLVPVPSRIEPARPSLAE